MSPIRAIARPLLSAPFVADAVSKLRTPATTATALRPHLERLARSVPTARSLADRPELVAKVLGGVEAGAAGLLAIGKAPRISAGLLVATQAVTLSSELTKAREEGTVVTTAVTRAGLIGGALVASVDSGNRNKLKAVRAKAKKATRKAERRAAKAESRASKAISEAEQA